MSKKVKVQSSYTRAAFDVQSYNQVARTIDVVFATETPVRRYDWNNDRYFNEVLGISDGEIDFTRLENGAPVLDSHGRWSITDVMGVVVKAWIENGEARATLRFSERADLQPIISDIVNGIIRNISVGYQVKKYQMGLIDPNADDIPTYRAVSWTPMEISFVPVPADPMSGTRAQDQNNNYEVTLIQNSNSSNMKNNGNRSAQPENEAATPVNAPAEGARASENNPEAQNENQPAAEAGERQQAAQNPDPAQAERQRAAAIVTAVRKAGLPVNFAEKLVNDGTSIDEARAAVIDEVAKRSVQPSTPVNVNYNGDENGHIRAAYEEALMFRADPSNKLTTERARDMRGASLIDFARGILDMNGIRSAGLLKSEIAERALTTSDFPALLANVANKFLRKAYTTAPQTWKPLASQMNAPDFKALTGVQFGGSLTLDEVQENGEYKYGNLKDSKDTFQLKSYGKIIKITRKAIINDDLNGFSRLAQQFGRAAATLESDTMWNIIINNQKLGDGKTLFHADHKNLAAAGAALTEDGLSAARVALMRQTGLDSKEQLNLLPVYLIVPIELLTTAQKLMHSINATKSDDVNPFNGAYTIITDARLIDPKAWYLTADPAQIDMLLYGYLEGQGLRTETRNGFEVDGVEVKVAMDFGAGVWDYRGFYKNPGA